MVLRAKLPCVHSWYSGARRGLVDGSRPPSAIRVCRLAVAGGRSCFVCRRRLPCADGFLAARGNKRSDGLVWRGQFVIRYFVLSSAPTQADRIHAVDFSAAIDGPRVSAIVLFTLLDKASNTESPAAIVKSLLLSTAHLADPTARLSATLPGRLMHRRRQRVDALRCAASGWFAGRGAACHELDWRVRD